MKVREVVGKAYAKAFARPGLAQKVNHAVFHLALRGMGYNNGWELDKSGEQWFIKNVLKKYNPGVCFDIGANVGDYSRELLNNTNAQVYAFEPLYGCVASLDKLLASSTRFGYQVTAVGAEIGTASIHFSDSKNTLASLSDEVSQIGYVGEANVCSLTVSVTTVDEMSCDFGWPQFMKIDVEGYEYEVLQGARGTIHSGQVKFIQIEWNLHQLMRGHTLKMLADMMPGYTPFQLLPRGMRRVDVNRPEANIFCYGNFVFVRDGDARSMR